MLKETAVKAAGFLEDRPKLLLFLAGGLMALEAYKLLEATDWFVKAFRAVREAELAAEKAARAASEALGG